MEWYEYLKPKNLLDSLFSSSPSTSTPAPVSSAPESQGAVSRLFQGIGSTAGETVAAAVKPIFPMLLVTAVVAVGAYYVMTKVK
jgi:hypothetical protein